MGKRTAGGIGVAASGARVTRADAELNRYLRLLERAPVPVITLDDRLTIASATPAASALLGATRRALLGKPLPSLVAPSETARLRSHLARCRRQGLASSRLSILGLDGPVRFHLLSRRILLRNGRPGYHTMLLTVDADHRAARRALQAAVVHDRGPSAARPSREENGGRLARALVAAQENERRRIARELHDQLGQHITGLSLGLKQCARVASSAAEVRRLVPRLQAMLEQMARDAHSLALELRPAALDELGLATAIANYAEQVSVQTGLETDVHCDLPGRLDPLIEITVYRVVQEALTNVVRHAHARHVSIIVDCPGRYVRAVIEDDGVGFSMARAKVGGARQRLGLEGMKERAALVGGELQVESRPGRGTTLFLRVPRTLKDGRTNAEAPPPARG